MKEGNGGRTDALNSDGLSKGLFAIGSVSESEALGRVDFGIFFKLVKQDLKRGNEYWHSQHKGNSENGKKAYPQSAA